MEDLIFALLEVLEPFISEHIKNKRVLNATRYLVIAVPFLFLILLFINLTVSADSWWEQILMGIIALAFLCGWIYINRQISQSET